MSSILKVDTIQNTGGTTGLTIDRTGGMLTPDMPAIKATVTAHGTFDSVDRLVVSDSYTGIFF